MIRLIEMKIYLIGCLSLLSVFPQILLRVTYRSNKNAMRKIIRENQITSLRIKVTDENGNLIYFNEFSLRFEIEIL